MNFLPVLHCLRGDAFVSNFSFSTAYLLAVTKLNIYISKNKNTFLKQV